jgi:hypothetical protein
MALRDMGSLVCVYHSIQQVGLARSELGNQEKENQSMAKFS